MPSDLAHPASHHLHYCEQRSRPEGSSLYYATLFVPPARRAAWLGAVTLIREIQSVPDTVNDPGLAAIKLAWWKTEMERACASSPSHPATLCMDAETARAIGTDSVSRLVQSVSGSRQWPSHFTTADRNHACHDWGGEAFCIAAAALKTPVPDEQTRQQLRSWGAAAMQLTQLLMLAPAIGRGWHPFAVEQLQAAGVGAESLRRREQTPAISGLIDQLVQQAEEQGEQAWRSLPKSTRLSLRPLRGLWRMRRAEIRLARQAGYPLLTQRLRITPLKKLWLAWSSHALRM